MVKIQTTQRGSCLKADAQRLLQPHWDLEFVEARYSLAPTCPCIIRYIVISTTLILIHLNNSIDWCTEMLPTQFTNFHILSHLVY